MADTVKVEPAELDEGRAIRIALATLAERVGRMEFAKIALERERSTANEQFYELEGREQTFLSTLTKKYGVGVLNLDTGDFTPADTQK